MKKLFNVTIENEICVMAENREQAESVARNSFEDEDKYNFAYWATEVRQSDPHINPDNEDCVPYGSIENKTCGEIVKEMQEAEELRKIRVEADKKQLKFGFYEGTFSK